MRLARMFITVHYLLFNLLGIWELWSHFTLPHQKPCCTSSQEKKAEAISNIQIHMRVLFIRKMIFFLEALKIPSSKGHGCWVVFNFKKTCWSIWFVVVETEGYLALVLLKWICIYDSRAHSMIWYDMFNGSSLDQILCSETPMKSSPNFHTYCSMTPAEFLFIVVLLIQ